MKKILSAIAVAALAATVQAATVTWNTGTMYTAKNADGDWTATSGNTGKIAANSASVAIYLVSQATFETYLGKTAKEVYDASHADAIANIAKNTVASNAGGLGVWKDTARNYGVGDKAYAIFVVDYTDATYGDFYAVGFGGISVGDSGIGKVTVSGKDYAYNTAINGVGKWTAVPEPTTVALLALGLAAVGLKRKIA